ncbi:MAG: xanthine dehydrogenase accessory factor [Thermoleophilaceae bacterium]|nr:xanthine dehydrogenase accessory factor [Thermoleophilaceae bacterium]
MTRATLSKRADGLAAARKPFVTAIVVRAQRPSSVRPGDSAIVLPDGTIEGFVGGACAEPSVRLHAIRVLETGEPLLLRIVPGDGEAPAQEGAVTVQNPCLSGGALEIFLEPRVPAPRVLAVGDTPIADALVSIGERVGLDVYVVAGGAEAEPADGDVAVVVASHGRGEEGALERALRAGVPYVGLVASRRRGAAVVEALRETGLADEQLRRLRTPAGLDIGARGSEEIAVSIVAEIIAVRRSELTAGSPQPTAVDPVCGMEVPAAPPTPSLVHEGQTVWFCCDGCRSAYVATHVISA